MKLKILAFVVVLTMFLTSTVMAAHNPRAPPDHGKDNGESVRTTSISLEKTKFIPKDVIASIASEGDGVSVTIMWTNNDRKNHDVHVHDSEDNMVAKSPTLAIGESWSLAFTSLGIYNIHCDIHPGMKGTVTIEN